MARPRLILCSGVSISEVSQPSDGCDILELDTNGIDGNVNVKITDFARMFGQELPARLLDLLEIASYVYAADCAVNRGNGFSNKGTLESWSRELNFVIPVSDVAFWQRQDVTELLRKILKFLSDDKYSFDFRPLKRSQSIQGYLEFPSQTEQALDGVSRVVMFSGGLDSLAGAIDTSVAGENLVLVSHRPSPILSKRQKDLFEALRGKVKTKILHVPVWINKGDGLDRESTQRTRSFLYASLGTVIAEAVRAGGVRFFENGVVSLNLPVADEVLRARASRTTHPLVLKLFTEFFQIVTEREFIVDNPYLFKTKAEVVQVIADNCYSELIGFTSSCAHQGRTASGTQYHCGTCSQCIDRRIAIYGAGLEKHDPEHDYATNVFLGSREEGYEQNMAVDYVAHANEMNNMTQEQMASQFSREISQAVRGTDEPSRVAQELIDLHMRHAKTVIDVVEKQISNHALGFAKGSLPASSLLVLVAGQKHRVHYWKRLADIIVKHLERGLPKACQDEKPKDEPHLQQICDGILQAQSDVLQREFPFMKWSASATKPDWSADELGLWVELKYVRKKTDIRPITDAIAADITKYGDNKRKVLYIVYDPNHLIVDEAKFSADIVKNGMMVSFIR